jgi:hypothetical protein
VKNACAQAMLIDLQGHKPLYANDDVAEYNVTNLNNGFTVLTESQVFPGSVHMGKCLTPFQSACQKLKLQRFFSLIFINFGSFLLNRIPN